MSLATIDQAPALPAISQELAAKGAHFDSLAIPENTKRAYRAAWNDFSQWCLDHGADSFPAAPSTVAAYLADRSDLKATTLQLRLAAISKAHQSADIPTPTKSSEVAHRMRGIKRAKAQEGESTAKKSPITKAKLTRLIGSLPDAPSSVRDRAILLVGFFGALRRSEIANLNVSDLEWTDEGLTLHLRLTKTDKSAEGQIISLPYRADDLCPVVALRQWLDAANIESGKVFRSINNGRYLGEGMSDRAIADVIKARLSGAGIDPKEYGGHSLRSGFVTEAFEQGHTDGNIQRQTRHKSIAVLRGYDRRERWSDNVAGAL